MNPWPSAYTFLNGKTLKVWSSLVEASDGKSEPGTVVSTDKAGIHVACADGNLVLSEVQLEGKKRMEADAFLRGFSIETGTKFTDHKE
jgi:methionyl-tRNA formyltransferase